MYVGDARWFDRYGGNKGLLLLRLVVSTAFAIPRRASHATHPHGLGVTKGLPLDWPSHRSWKREG